MGTQVFNGTKFSGKSNNFFCEGSGKQTVNYQSIESYYEDGTQIKESEKVEPTPTKGFWKYIKTIWEMILLIFV